MHTLSNHTGCEGVEIVSNLDRSILYFISENEIKGLLRIACQHYDALWEVYYDSALESPYYTQLVSGTLGELIGFLRSFSNKLACGFAHETNMILEGVKLEPENCKYQANYAGCGHPELNGLLIVEVLADYLLGQVYPQLRRAIQIEPSIHKSRNQQDGGAAQLYKNPRLVRNPDGSIPINSKVQGLQFDAGKMVEVRCHRLAGEIENAYK